MLENFHTHTVRCRHAVGTEEEYVLQAIARGLTTLGFSDHTPFLFPGDYYTHMRMYPNQLEDYVRTVLSLKEIYAPQIDIRLGLEVEYYPDRMDDLLTMLAPYDIEYMILGQHWVGNEQNEPYAGRPTEDASLLERYINQVIAGLDTGLFSYLAHPDLMPFTGSEDTYRHLMTKLCQAAKVRNIPLEINLLGLRSQRFYPNDVFWEIAGETGCSVVIGSDAHAPQDVADVRSERLALKMADKFHLNLLEKVPIRSYKSCGAFDI